MKNWKVIAICIVAAIGTLYITVLALLLAPVPDRYYAEEEVVLSKVATAYGVPKDWPSVKYTIYCVIFRRGKPISEVEPELTRFGEWGKWGTEDSFSYRLYGLSAGNKVFWVNTTLEAGKIIRITVIERSDQSDSQSITCGDGTYSDNVERQTPAP